MPDISSRNGLRLDAAVRDRQAQPSSTDLSSCRHDGLRLARGFERYATMDVGVLRAHRLRAFHADRLMPCVIRWGMVVSTDLIRQRMRSSS